MSMYAYAIKILRTSQASHIHTSLFTTITYFPFTIYRLDIYITPQKIIPIKSIPSLNTLKIKQNNSVQKLVMNQL